MFEHLASRLGNSFSLLSSRSDYRLAKSSLPPKSQVASVNYLFGGERLRRILSVGFGAFPVDRAADLKSTDWVYCPKEQPVCVQRARLAVTVHDVLAFEPSISGLAAGGSWSRQLRANRVMRRIIDRADVILTVSAFTADRLAELFGIARNRCVVVGNGVADTYFNAATDNDCQVLAKYGLSNSRYFVSVGSLTRRKAGDVLLSIAENIIKGALDGARIIVTGRRHDPDLVDQYNRLLARHSNMPLRLIGYVPDDEQAALLRQSAALVFPSRYEGFGIPILEAMASGTRVICSDQAALQEVAGGLAVTLSPTSANTAIGAMQQVLNEPYSTRECFINRGRIRARDFTWHASGARLMAVLEES
jgi:glycosyltransferase involved in cell wall biosynthesis